MTTPGGSGESSPRASTGNLAEEFRKAAERYPDHLAVHDDDAKLSYREIAQAAGGVARALSHTGLRPGDRVGLLLDHGSPMVSAALGTLAAGGCYVPLDPGYPAGRLSSMTRAAGVSVLIAGRARTDLGRTLAGDSVLLQAEDLGPADLCVVDAEPDSPAYLLYTSGSTGQPKGVAQTHRNVLHGVGNHIAGFGIGDQDKLSLLSSFSFDMAVTDMYAALLGGAAVVTVDIKRNGIGHLARALADRGVTVYHSTPTAYEHLIAALGTDRLAQIRVVLLGGEQVTRAHALAARRHFSPDCLFVNGYGATEASFAVQYRIGPADQLDRDVIPIGYPLPGYEIALLDPCWPEGDDPLEPPQEGKQARGSGEMAIRSSFLAPGYWQDRARSAERFSQASDGTPVYRTGDYGIRLADGRLVCLGRTDRQVKIRGHRVELGEVEAHLANLPGIAHAAATTRAPQSGAGLMRIVGYVVPRAGAQVDPAGLRRALAERLPDYLVPAEIVVMDEFPLTLSGKVDVAALGRQTPAVPPSAQAVGEAPVTAIERLVAAAWCEVLGVNSVGVDAGFFDLGGHSLTMVALQQRLASSLSREIPMVALIDHPTVRQFARYLDGTEPDHPDRVTGRMAKRRARLGAR